MNLSAILQHVVSVFDDVGVPYVVVGSVASSARGFPRTTNDVDIVADLRPEHVPAVVARLGHEFYVDQEAVSRAIALCRSFNAIHAESGFKVDVFVPAAGSVGRQQLARRTLETLGAEGGQRLFVSTAEDVVLAKLEWFRASGETSERQWRDVVGVLRVQGAAIDRTYLREWAVRFGVLDLLERALADADSG